MSSIEIRFTRRNYENISQKATVLTTMLSNPKIAPILAFTHSGMFSDPQLAYRMSMDYAEEQEKKAAELATKSKEAINSNDAEGFTNFKAAIQGYFPNISGVIGRLTYQDNQLTAMDISITTQFYGYSQINSFAKLVLSNAKKFLPTNAKIEIKIESVSDTQALISKNKPDDEYYVHIFN